MVCSLAGGQMATMATILEAGSTSQTITEDVGPRKLAAQYIHRELREADEANLLDEEDMHVFGLRPMTDPLNLVCCNSCKKPVKASQYAAHAEICKSLSSVEEIAGGTGHKKPPRKERKKLLTTCAVAVGEPERSRKVGSNIAASDSHLEEQIQMKTSFSTEVKHGALFMDGSVVSPGNTDYLAGSMPSPKRSKLIAAESLLMSDHIESTSGVTKSFCRSSQEAHTCEEYPNESRRGSEKTCSNVVGHQIPRNIHDCYSQIQGQTDVPAPLATKTFYSQRNHRLRSALSHLYYESSAKQHGHESVNMQLSKGNKMTSCTSSPKNFCHDQIDDRQEKGGKNMSSSVQRSDQIFAQSSEVFMDDSETCPPTTKFSDQFSVNNVLGPRITPPGTLGSNYLSNPYSFAGNSGKLPGTMQQPKGSVPVV